MADGFKNADELIAWRDRWKRATQHTRALRATYAAKGRAYYSGIQWIQTGTGPAGFMQAYSDADGRSWTDAYMSNEPMRTTLNKITASIVQAASGTNWNAIEVTATPRAASEDPSHLVTSDIVETMANVAVEMTGLVRHAQKANFERYLDGMHGLGVRLVRRDLPGPDGQARPDYDLEAFDFDGYMLTLDPTATSRDLRDHPFVMLTEVVTYEAARRRYGDEALKGVDPKKLPTLGSLRPTELHFYGITKGALFTPIAECAHEPAMIVDEIFMKSGRRRFDRYYVVADFKGENGKRVLREDGANPYGGCGLPLGQFYGDRRPGELFAISGVGAMIDSQDKLNAYESLAFQQLWDYTTRHVTYIDEAWFGRKKASPEEIIQAIESGYVFGNSGGSSRFQPPAMVARPTPYQGLGMESERYAGHVREAARLTPMHAGQVKTHVADSSHQTALELVEMPEDDRREADVATMQALLEVAVGTMIRAVKQRGPTVVQALVDAGVNDVQLARILEINDERLDGVTLTINPEAVRRRSRGQAKRDLETLMQYGVQDNPMIRQALSALDYPVYEKDKQAERWAHQAVAAVLRGQPYEPVPLGEMVVVAEDAIRSGLMSDAARRNPEVRQALIDAWEAQKEAELAFAGVPLDDQMAAGPQDVGPEMSPMDQIFGAVSI